MKIEFLFRDGLGARVRMELDNSDIDYVNREDAAIIVGFRGETFQIPFRNQNRATKDLKEFRRQWRIAERTNMDMTFDFAQ